MFDNIATSGGTIVIVFFTGVLTARLLTTDGRGQVSAVAAWLLTLTWASSLGFPRAMAYYEAKGADRSGTIVATMASALVPLGLMGVGLAQLLIPHGFAAQTDETVNLARLFMCGIPFVVAAEACGALLAGLERFHILNRGRLAQPLVYLVGLLVLWATDHVSPWTVLTAQVGSYMLVAITFLGYLFRTVGPIHRPELGLVKRGLRYGLRLQGVTLGDLVTGRLDLLMLPAFVTATSVGFYAISVNITSMIMSLFGSLALVVFPVATRAHAAGDLTVVHQALRLCLVGGLFATIVIGVAAPWLISFVYGHDYLGAIPSLLLLLPGVLLWSGTSVIGAGLQAAGRPGRASLAQVAGVVVTVVGLPLALPRCGIEGAALVSTIAYTFTFVVVMWILRREPGFSVKEALSLPAVTTDLKALVRGLRATVAKRRGSTPGE